MDNNPNQNNYSNNNYNYPDNSQYPNYNGYNDNYNNNYNNNYYNGYQNYGYPPKKNKNNPLIWILIILSVILVIGIISLSAMLMNTDKNDSDDSKSESPKPTEHITVDKDDEEETEEAEETSTPTPPPTPTPTPTPAPTTSYTPVKSNASWGAAAQSAANSGGSLVTIDSEAEFRQVCSLADSYGIKVFWINGYTNYVRWLPGEPSTYSEDGIRENYLMIFKVKGSWYFNDSVNDVSDVYSGKMGYIIEY